MDALIKIQKSKGGRNIVSAKELYLFLSVDDGSHFARWSKTNIEDLFEVNIDYQTLRHGGEKGRPSIDYVITIDTAKEISMMSRCERGKIARRYFIDCENKLHQLTPAIPSSFAEALELAAHQAREIEAKDKLIAIQAPKADYADRVLESDNQLVDVGQASKLLKLPFGRNSFFKRLREDGVFFKNRNEPKQEFIERGYFDVRKSSIERNEHPDFTVIKVLVSPRGLFWLSKKYGGNSDTSIPVLNLQ